MNSENSKTIGSYRLLLDLSNKTNLKRSGKYVVLSNLSMHCIWENTKRSYKSYKKVSAPTWN